MGMKSQYLSLVALASMMAMGERSTNFREPSETSEERERRLAFAKRSQNEAKGLKEFHYGGNSLWALKQETADKKARKLGWI